MADIELSRILDHKVVRDFSKLFNTFTGMTTSFSFPRWKKGSVDFIPRSAKCDFCQMVQEVPGSMKICQISGAEAEEKMKNSAKPFIYSCRLGIAWIGVPVYINGKYVGGVWAGNVVTRKASSSDFNILRKKLKSTDIDLDALEKAYYEIPVLDKGRLKVSLDLLTLIVNYIVDKENNAVLQESIYQKQHEVAEVMAARLELETDLQEKINEVSTLRKQFLSMTSASQLFTVTEDEGTRYQRIIKEVLAVIDKHYAEEITLIDVAEYINLSPNYLSTVFHRECGCKFVDYLIQKRISKACEFFQDINLNVTEVGIRVGYGDARYFGQLFKRIVGISPSAYRNRISVSDQPKEMSLDGDQHMCIGDE